MTTRNLASVYRRLRDLAGMPGGEWTDGQLLQRFAARQDEEAFSALLRRHGPLVLGVCRRVLRHEHDAEDAFQATFLILARKPLSIRSPEALPAWLHATAYRCAAGLKRTAARRRAHEAQVRPPQRQPEGDTAWRELQVQLDEEMERLPEKYRAPFVLCCLEGMSRTEAARRLGWKAGTLSGRLAQARLLLQRRLVRRGVSLPAVLCAVEMSRGAAAAVPAALAQATVQAAVLYAAGEGLPAGGQVAALVHGASGVLPRGVAWLACLLAAVGVAAAGAGALDDGKAKPLPAPAADAARVAAPPTARPAPRPEGVDLLGDPLPPWAVARLGTVRLRHGAAVNAVAFSPDGTILASTGLDGILRLWHAADGRPLRQMPGPVGVQARALAFTPDGEGVAVAYNDGVITLWEVHTGRERQRFTGHGRPVHALAFSPDGKTLATAGKDKMVRLWDMATATSLRRLEGHQEVALAVAFSPDGKTIASASGDKTVRLWDAATGKERRKLLGHATTVLAVAFSPDGKTLASAGADPVIRLWDVATGEERRPLTGHKAVIRGLAFAPDGKTLASAAAEFGMNSISGEVKLWDLGTGKPLPHFADRTEPFEAVAFSPGGKTLAAAASHCNHLRLWDTATGKERCRFGPQGQVAAAGFTPDGKAILTVCYGEHGVALWDRDGRELRRFPGDLGTLSADGKTVVTMFRKEGAVRFHDATTGKELRRTDCPGAKGRVSLAHGGRLLAAAGEDNSIGVYDTVTGKELCRLRGHAGAVRPMQFSPDGKLLASAAEDRSVRLWEVASGKELRRLALGDEVCSHLAFAPDGRVLAVGRFRGGLRLWDVVSGEELRRFEPEENSRPRDMQPPAFSPDGRMLATGSWDGAVRLWEVATGGQRARLTGHQGWVSGLVFAPDGKALVSGSSDNSALVWDIARVGLGGHAAGDRLSAEELQGLWAELGGEDASRAYRALVRLGAVADSAVPFLREHLPPLQKVKVREVERLIADLDDKRFAVRQAATEGLEKLGPAAEGALRRALAGRPTAETRLRLDRLVRKLESEGAVEWRRTLRALEALEWAGTSAARQALRALAEEAPGGRRSGEARAALQRLAGRVAVP